IGARFKELLRKYGKVGIGVHCSISMASVSGLYVAIRSNVDVESMLEKVGLPNLSKNKKEGQGSDPPREKPGTADRNKTAELVASSGGALALAILINKALFPVRVPITLAVTPPVARFLARRNIIK
ncbi:hypothetical protein M569_07490, partial [Genlisea aurea]